MSFLYLVTIGLLILLFIGMLLLMKRFKNIKITNIVFISVIFVCYLTMVILGYIHNGLYDWNFHILLPTANISPFMFFITPLYLVIPKNIRKYFGTLIAILLIGMILSPVLTCANFFRIGYKFHPRFVIDYFIHIVLALFGVYLVQSGQVELNKKNCLVAAGIIYGVCFIMIILNLIFDTSFFGLSLRGKHSIYNMVLVSNSFLSALIYFAGLAIVLAISFVLQKILLRVLKKEYKSNLIYENKEIETVKDGSR